MSRNIDAATAAELAKSTFTIINIIEFQGIGGTNTYLTDGPVDFPYNGNTYVSTRGLMGITDIREEEDIRIENVDISLSGVASENVSLFLDYDYIDRRVLIHRAIIGSDYAVIGAPVLVFDGRLDQPRLTEDFESRTAVLTISASSHWSDFVATNGRHSNNSEQKVLYPSDDFFSFATDTQKDIKWGKE